MDITGKPLTNCRYFSVPFILISAVFFSLYLFIAAVILANLIPGLPYYHYFPEFDFGYMFNSTFLFAILMIVSFAGSILLVRRMIKQSLYCQAGLPLCILMGIITALLVIYTFYEPSNPALRYLGYAFKAEILAYAVLPACAAYFLVSWKKICGSVSETYITISTAVGILGLGFFVYVLYNTLTYVPPPVSTGHDNFMAFTQAEGLIILFGLFYGAILLPAVGLIFLTRGSEYRRLPSESNDTE